MLSSQHHWLIHHSQWRRFSIYECGLLFAILLFSCCLQFRAKAVLQRTTDHTRHVSQNGNSVNDGKGEKGKGDESSVVASPREASKSVTPRPAASPSGSHGSASRQSANETSHSRRRKRDESSVATGNKTDLVHISKPVVLFWPFVTCCAV